MQEVARVQADEDDGLIGDRYGGRTGKRQVTLIQAEHLSVIASCIGISPIEPSLLRRNVVVRGLNLLATRDKVIQLGHVRLEITGLCHPCSLMEKVLGPGGYNAMRGHGGVTARVLQSGAFAVGDAVSFLGEIKSQA